MADQWFIIRGGVRLGPYDAPTLRGLAAGGKLLPNELVQGAGAAQAIPAGSIPGLFPAGAAAPQPQTVPSGEPRWFALRNNQEHGPLSSAELIQLANSGSLTPQDLVRREDLPNWVRASEVQGLFPAAPQQGSGTTPAPAGTAAAGPAFTAAPQAIQRLGGDRDQNLGESFGSCLYNAQEAAAALLSAPLLLSFYTAVFVVASGLAFAGVVTAFLYPVFVMGYVSVLHAYLTNRRPTLQSFLGFLRHGWDALWHLAMLLAAFMVTLGMLVAPVAIVGGLAYTVGGGTLFALLAATDSARPAPKAPETPAWMREMEARRPTESPELPKWVAEAGGEWLRTAVTAGFFAALCLLYTPFFASLILFYYLVFDVSKNSQAKPTGEPDDPKTAPGGADAKPTFDLVFDSFGRMLVVGRRCWKELFFDGMLNALLLVVLPIGLAFAAVKIDARFAAWYITFASPLLMATLFVYLNVFMVVACIGLGRWAPKSA